MASRSRVLYVGVTNDLVRRVSEHKRGLGGVTSRYRVTRLVHREEFTHINDAIAREKALKGWRRSRKVALIEGSNPTWRDLAEGWSPSLRSGQALRATSRSFAPLRGAQDDNGARSA